MNEYSFLEGVIDAGKTLRDYLVGKRFENVYNSLSVLLKGMVDGSLRAGIKALFKRIGDELGNGTPKPEYYKRLGLSKSITEILQGVSGIGIIDKSFELAGLLQKTYPQAGASQADYNAGNRCIALVLEREADANKGVIDLAGAFLPSLSNAAKLLREALHAVSGLRKPALVE